MNEYSLAKVQYLYKMLYSFSITTKVLYHGRYKL